MGVKMMFEAIQSVAENAWPVGCAWVACPARGSGLVCLVSERGVCVATMSQRSVSLCPVVRSGFVVCFPGFPEEGLITKAAPAGPRGLGCLVPSALFTAQP